MDFTNYKFRCSSLGKLMVNPRSKSEVLSETTKAYLREIYIEEVHGRRKEIDSKYLEKGLFVEDDSLGIASGFYGKLLIKNEDTLENDYIKGTPDIKLGDVKILDVKSCWDIWTFAAVDGTNKDYYYQLQGYMNLTGRKEADLAYCLADTPTHLIVQEKSRTMFKLGLQEGTKEYDEVENQIEKNMTYSDIDEKDRIKVFQFKYDEEGFEKIKVRIFEARSYLNTIKL
jgi:hypothetical protein